MHLKIVMKVDLKCSYHSTKKNVSSKIYCGKSFTIYVYQIIILYTLNVYNVIYPYVNKIGRSPFYALKKKNMQSIKLEQWIKIAVLRKLLPDLDSLFWMKMTKHNCTTHTCTHTKVLPNTQYMAFYLTFPPEFWEVYPYSHTMQCSHFWPPISAVLKITLHSYCRLKFQIHNFVCSIEFLFLKSIFPNL